MKLRDPEVAEKYNELVEKINSLSDEEIQRVRGQLDSQQARFDKGVELAEKLSNLVNSMHATDEKRGFTLAMKQEHRTLQQSAFQFFLTWAYFIAQEYSNNDIDPRNEAMVKTAKKLKECLGEYGYSLPFI